MALKPAPAWRISTRSALREPVRWRSPRPQPEPLGRSWLSGYGQVAGQERWQRQSNGKKPTMESNSQEWLAVDTASGRGGCTRWS